MIILIKYSNILAVETYNFCSPGQALYKKEYNHDGILAIDWSIGKKRLTKKEVLNTCNFSLVKLTISNPNIFLDNNDIVTIERRMYRGMRTEFILNGSQTTLSVIRETLSTPYNEELLHQLKNLSLKLI